MTSNRAFNDNEVGLKQQKLKLLEQGVNLHGKKMN